MSGRVSSRWLSQGWLRVSDRLEPPVRSECSCGARILRQGKGAHRRKCPGLWLDRIPVATPSEPGVGGATEDDVELALGNLRTLLSDDRTSPNVRVQAAREMLRFRAPDTEKLGKKGEQEELRGELLKMYRESMGDERVS